MPRRRSAIKATGVDTLLATATAETTGCTIGDVGPYGWSIEGKGTVLTLTATGADACPAREQALSGSWVRSDLPPPAGLEATLAPGTHLTSSFDPFGDVGSPGRLSYTVPAGWQAPEDASATLGLQHLPGDAQGPPSMIFLFARPGLAAEINDGEPCGAFSDAPGVGHRVADIVAAIMARPGVVSAQPVSVTVGGYQGQMLDLRLAPSWTDGCIAPEGKAIGVPLIHVAGSPVGPSVGLGPDAPVRLILLDLTGGRTLAVAVACIGPSQPDQIAEQFAQAMPIINSFEFHPPGS